MQFDFRMTTPKAFANFSPGLERSDNPGTPIRNKSKTLKALANGRTLSGFNKTIRGNPRVVASSNPALKLANAFGVVIRKSNCTTTVLRG